MLGGDGMSNFFSPSLTRRKEPPHSLATVLYVNDGRSTVMVQHRGRTLTATTLDDTDDDPVMVGMQMRLLECPRNTFWVLREGISWYANPLSNWLAAGLKANVAMEYLLKYCPKWSPLFIGEDGALKKRKGTDGEDLKNLFPQGTNLDGIDAGYDSGNGGGSGSQTESEYNDTLPVWITCSPVVDKYTGGTNAVSVQWGSKDQESVTIRASKWKGGLPTVFATWSGLSGTASVSIDAGLEVQITFVAEGNTGAADQAVWYCYYPIIDWYHNGIFKPYGLPVKITSSISYSDIEGSSFGNLPIECYNDAGGGGACTLTLTGATVGNRYYNDFDSKYCSWNYTGSFYSLLDSDRCPESNRFIGVWLNGIYHRRKLTLSYNEDRTQILVSPSTILMTEEP